MVISMPKTKSIRVRLTDEEWSQAEVKSLALFGVNNKSRLIRKLLRDFAGFSLILLIWKSMSLGRLSGSSRGLQET